MKMTKDFGFLVVWPFLVFSAVTMADEVTTALERSGSAVICSKNAYAAGATTAQDLSNELNERIAAVRVSVKASQPTLVTVSTQTALCVTLTVDKKQ